MTTATIIPSLTNNPPSRANPTAFPTDGDSFLNDLAGIVSAQNTVASELTAWNSEIEAFKNQSAASETNAESSKNTALTQARNAAASQVSLWVSGTTYAVNQMVYSSVDGRQYKRILAGAGTTDPSSDPTNWEPLGWEYITNYPDIRPTLDLNFARSQAVDPRITFTRNSIATYFDKFGVMQTAGINQPRIDFDPVTGECKGLLIEEARTNVLLNSATLSTQNVTTTAVAYTLSFYGTGSITRSGTSSGVLTGISVSDRVYVTFTPTAGTLTLTVSGSVTKAQLEVGSFPTSYIPTSGTSVTRQADVASLEGINFSNWFRASEGTFITKSSSSDGLTSRTVFSLSDGTLQNYIWLLQSNQAGTNSFYAQVVTSGVEQAALGIGLSYSPSTKTCCVSYKENSFLFSRDGTLFSDSSGSVPVVNRLYIGNDRGGVLLSGHISRILYFPKQFNTRVIAQSSRP